MVGCTPACNAGDALSMTMPIHTLRTADPVAAVLRPPRLEDAAAIWEVIRGSGVLDVNSPYAYLLVCAHHAATSIVAESQGRVVGFVSAYRPPERGDVLFVWQVGVERAHRRAGLATRMLVALLDRLRAAGVRFIEATVTPSNLASRRLFSGLARGMGASLEVNEGFARRHFPAGDHEPEELFRIGPVHRPGGSGS